MDRDHYVLEAERQLNDSTSHELLGHESTDQFAKEVSKAVEEIFDDYHTTELNMRYLIEDQPKASRFSLLPNIHNAGNPGRPIVSANGHSTEKLSVCGPTSAAPCQQLTLLFEGHTRLLKKTSEIMSNSS